MNSMDLAASVLDYYFTRAGELPREKRFHLANRIAAWNGDNRAIELLKECRHWYVPNPLNDQTLDAMFDKAGREAERTASKILGYNLRKPYFDKYSELLATEAELFRLRHLSSIYAIDASQAFLRRRPLKSLQQLESKLLADKEAVRILSSWAVNYIYLLHRIVLKDGDGVNAEALYNLGQGYDLTNEEQTRLFIYLYTHSIIADSNFYVQSLSSLNLPVYRRMLGRLEEVISDRPLQTSLDTKLEFLVCCRLVGHQSGLATKIYEECAASLSPEGTFIIDTHNVFSKNPARESFEASEHRNVLFIMSLLPRKS